MNPIGHNLQFRHFLTYDIWKEAIKLINYQITEKKPPRPNRHYNNINFFYYEKISNQTNTLSDESYFNNKIANNFFYGLEKEFFHYHYTVPKIGIGLRKYTFIGYPMTVLYYSIGLYLLKLTQQFIEDCKNEDNIRFSFYGGNLKFTNNQINANHESTYYKHQYDLFKKQIKEQLKNQPESKVVLKLDIQNYYETIKIDKLLDLISYYVKPSDLKKNCFDTSTKEMLIFYFNFINNGNSGIPQGYTNTASSFIGYLYLIFGDLFISDLIEEFNSVYNTIENYQIIRYVDDTYISLGFSKNTLKNDKENLIFELLKNISDIFYSKLNLRFNSKLEIFFLDNLDDQKNLEKSIKRTSPDLPINDEENKETPQKKFEKIIQVINKIKSHELVFLFKEVGVDKYIEVLNEIYDRSVEEIINKQNNLTQLKEAFNGFNFDLFRIHPRVLTILISKTIDEKETFTNYLLEKSPLTTFDADLIINFLSQNNFTNQKLFEKLGQNKSIKPIINQFTNTALVYDKDFYEFPFCNVSTLSNDINISEQTRLRIYHERLCEYSIALNHLLNEFHAICLIKDSDATTKDYNAVKVLKYLSGLKVKSDIKSKIRNLFDRRNKNTISHPGSNEVIAWAVSKNEYEEYKESVKKCLSYILGIKENLVVRPLSVNNQNLTNNDSMKIQQISNIIYALSNHILNKEKAHVQKTLLQL